MSRRQRDFRCHAGVERLTPARGAKTPAITRLQARKTGCWNRRREVIAALFAEGEKIRRDLNADDVRPIIDRRCLATAGAEKAGFRSAAAFRQLFAKDVALAAGSA